jgi:hypothetical protein
MVSIRLTADGTALECCTVFRGLDVLGSTSGERGHWMPRSNHQALEKGTPMKRSHAHGLLVWSLAGFALLSGGCMGRLVGEGAEKALGPKGEYWETKRAAASKRTKVLASYRRIELGTVNNEIGANLPADFISKFKAEFAKQLRESKLPKDASGKTLVINVDVIHYENADMGDSVLGPLEQVVARINMLDKESQQVLAAGNAIGRTGKTVGMGVDWKARGLAKALIKWVSDYSSMDEDSDEKRRD